MPYSVPKDPIIIDSWSNRVMGLLLVGYENYDEISAILGRSRVQMSRYLKREGTSISELKGMVNVNVRRAFMKRNLKGYSLIPKEFVIQSVPPSDYEKFDKGIDQEIIDKGIKTLLAYAQQRKDPGVLHKAITLAINYLDKKKAFDGNTDKVDELSDDEIRNLEKDGDF